MSRTIPAIFDVGVFRPLEPVDLAEGTRFARKDKNTGKSGGVRVCYAYFKKHWTVLLVMAYEKSRKDTLTAEEKRGIKEYLTRIDKWLDERSS